MIFICPSCGAPLSEEPNRWFCPRGHSFDRARSGYVNLLLPGDKHAKLPGDNKLMVAARQAFLNREYYRPLADALCRAAVQYLPRGGRLLDVGCGEGYYTAAICEALTAAGKTPRTAGIDISKEMMRRAAKRAKQAELAVASAYRLPVADETIDLLLDCFSPLAIDEFRRVLKPGGHFLYVVPAEEHLWEMKQVLYDRPYRNETKETPYEGSVSYTHLTLPTILEV